MSRTVKENGAGGVGRSSRRPEVRNRRCVLGRLHWGEADGSRVRETWEGAGNAWLVTVPLAESVLGIRCYPSRQPAGVRTLPRACAQALCPDARRDAGRSHSRWVRSAHLLLGRPKSLLVFFFFHKMLRKKLEGPFWAALNVMALALSTSGWANLSCEEAQSKCF